MASFLPSSLNKIFLLSVVLFCGTVWTQSNLPADISKCHAGDGTCIAKTITDIIHRFPKGYSDFGLPKLDEIVLQNITLSEASGDSPVQLNLKFNTFNVYGFEKTVMNRVVGFDSDIRKSKFEVYGNIPSILIKGDYEANGRVLVLPINGKGNAQIKLKNLKFGLKIKVSEEIKDGKVYGKLGKIKSTLEPENMHVNMENLFNSNKELSDSLNQLINANWQDVWSELEVGINSAVADIVRRLMASVSSTFPYENWYLEEKDI